MSDQPMDANEASQRILTPADSRGASWDKARAWLNLNKVFFDTLAVFIVSFAGLVVAGYYGCVQRNLAETQIELSQSELELSRIQTAVARAGVDPRFSFSCNEHKTAGLWQVNVTAHDASVYELSGRCIGFLEVTNAANETKRIELRDMYWSNHGDIVGGNALTFFWLSDLLPSEFLGYKFADVQSTINYMGIPSLVQPESLRNKKLSVRPCCFLVVEYFDATRQRQRQLFEMNPIGQYAKPIDQLPLFDQTIDATPFVEGGKVDVARYVAAVRPILDQHFSERKSTSSNKNVNSNASRTNKTH